MGIDGNAGSRSRVEEGRGEKRSSTDMEPDGDMEAWFSELCRIPGEARDSVMMLDVGAFAPEGLSEANPDLSSLETMTLPKSFLHHVWYELLSKRA